MFRLSQRADYGLILLSKLASKEGRFSIAQIARENKISPRFLSQIASELKKAGLISSKEGVSGGYTLAKKPDKIRLSQVLKILEGDLVEGKCFEKGHKCSCGADKVWQQLEREIYATVASKTVADIAKGRKI